MFGHPLKKLLKWGHKSDTLMTAIYWNIRNRHFGKYFHGIVIKDTSGTKGNKVTLGAIVIQVKLETVNKRLKQMIWWWS